MNAIVKREASSGKGGDKGIGNKTSDLPPERFGLKSIRGRIQSLKLRFCAYVSICFTVILVLLSTITKVEVIIYICLDKVNRSSWFYVSLYLH